MMFFFKAALFRLNNGHRKFVDLTVENGDFPVRYVKVYQRVYDLPRFLEKNRHFYL